MAILLNQVIEQLPSSIIFVRLGHSHALADTFQKLFIRAQDITSIAILRLQKLQLRQRDISLCLFKNILNKREFIV